MLKILGIVFMALALVGFDGNPQTHKTEQAKTAQGPSTPIADVSVEQTETQTPAGKEKQHVHADVRIIQTPAKDRYDKASFWVSVALAVIGSAGVIVGICTLLYLRRQTAAIEQQTEHLAQQSDFLLAKERARIVLSFKDTESVMTIRTDMVQTKPFHLIMNNDGGTMAFNVSVGYEAMLSESETIPPRDTLYWNPSPSHVLAGKQEETGPMTIDIPLLPWTAAKFFAYLRVNLKYNDIFHPNKPNEMWLVVRRKFIAGRTNEAVSTEFWEACDDPQQSGQADQPN